MIKTLLHTFRVLSLGLLLGFAYNNANSQTYCSATPSSYFADEFISSITFNGITLVTGQTNTVHYKDNTVSAPIQTIQRSINYNLSVTLGTSYPTDNIAVWVDWDQNGTFDNAISGNERYTGIFTPAITSTIKTTAGLITVPATARAGQTRMRVRLTYGTSYFPCGSDYSGTQYGTTHDFTVNVYVPTNITTQPVSNVNLCTTAGTSTLSVVADGTISRYQWQRFNPTNSLWEIVGANSPNYAVPLNTTGLFNANTNPLTLSANFRVVVTGTDAIVRTSNTATLTASVPATASVPVTSSGCENTLTTITATLGGSFNNVQWQRLVGTTWTNISGATSNVLTFANLQFSDQGGYRITLNNLASCNSGAQVLAQTNLVVVRLFGVVSVPAPITVGCVDIRPLELSVNVIGTINGYQWRRNNIDIVGNNTATTPNFRIERASKNDNGSYTCDVTYADCNGQRVFTTQPSVVNFYDSFEIKEQPTAQSICENQTAVLPIVALGRVFTYQWRKDGVNLTLQENPYANSSILYIERANHRQSGVYTCLIDAENCTNGRDFFTTTPVAVYVKRGTQITQVEKENKAVKGSVVSLSIQAHVAPIPPQMIVNIQWYKGTAKLIDNNKFAGSKSSLLTINNVQTADFGNDYWVIVEGRCTSDTAKAIGIEELIPANITLNALTDANLCNGSNHSFTIDATINNTNTLTYQWYRDGNILNDNPTYAGTKTNTLNITNLSNNFIGAYTVEVSSVLDNVKSTSNKGSISLIALPTLDTQSRLIMDVETGKELKVFANFVGGDVLSYKWMKDNVSIPNATTNEYIVASAKTTDAGEYSVEIMTGCGARTFTISNVTITAASTVDNGGGGGTTTSVEDNNYIVVSPNPTSDIINLNLTNMNINEIVIINSLGVEVFRSNNLNASLQLDVNKLNLSNGQYLITLSGNNKNYYAKFMVNK